MCLIVLNQKTFAVERKGEPMRAIDADSLIRLVMDSTILGKGVKQAFVALVNGEPTAHPERDLGTCFDCPLSHGCPKINGCTNDEAMEYASDIHEGCPISAQPEIIRCKDCKHWTMTCGDEQCGLGDCDVFDKHLVMCNGYCAWAERREDGSD